MDRLGLVVLLSMALTGCSAHLDTSMRKSTPYAPVNEINGGVVSYLNQGAKWVKAKRRTNAYKKMGEYCGGPYKIVQEGEANGTSMAVPLGGALFFEQEQRVKIRFECIEG